jgi:2-methylcitrate dehydratase PrpD
MVESPTKVLSEYVAEARFEDLPESVVNKAKHCILDSIGCAIGGASTQPGKIIIDFFQRLNGIPESTVYATLKKIPCIHASYINGYLANVLDFDDVYTQVSHPGATTVPPAMAVGERNAVSGKDLINAIVLGYEVSLRIAMAITPSPERYKKAWGNSTHQIFGAAVVSSKLLNSDIDQIRTALGLSGVIAPVPHFRKMGLELAERPFSWAKNNYGWACMGGVLAALQAKEGFIGNQYVLDGEKGFWAMAGSDRCDFQGLTSNLGKEYLILNNSFKYYACCGWTHSTLEATRAILVEHPIKSQKVKSVRVKTFFEVVENLGATRPANIIDAQFSLPHLIALTLVGKPPNQGIKEENLKDPEVINLAEKVVIEIDPTADEIFFQKKEWTSTVVIEMDQGEIFSKSINKAKGDPGMDLSFAEMTQKFMDLAKPILGKGRTESLIQFIKDLEEVRNISSLFS